MQSAETVPRRDCSTLKQDTSGENIEVKTAHLFCFLRRDNRQK